MRKINDNRKRAGGKVKCPGHRYRLTLSDESRLTRIWSVKAGIWRVALACGLLIGAGIGIGVLIVGFTPVKRQMPGYMTGADRLSALNAMMRVDSLYATAQTNQAFIDNLATLMDTDREPGDSLKQAGKPQTQLSLDSLIGSSARERRFVAMMDESEKYNLKVLSPLAAEGMIWSHPVPEGIILEQSRSTGRLQFVVPRGSGVCAMADGRVIDRTYDASTRTYALILQHDKGFVSRLSGVGNPLADKGAHVVSGQMLTEQAPPGAKYVSLEMWRDGTPLLPADYVGRPESSLEKQSIEAPRGR